LQNTLPADSLELSVSTVSLELAADVNTSDFSSARTPSLLCLLLHSLELHFFCRFYDLLSRGFVTCWSEVLVLCSVINSVSSFFSDSGCPHCF